MFIRYDDILIYFLWKIIFPVGQKEGDNKEGFTTGRNSPEPST